jgi:hypothetical protein
LGSACRCITFHSPSSGLRVIVTRSSRVRSALLVLCVGLHVPVRGRLEVRREPDFFSPRISCGFPVDSGGVHAYRSALTGNRAARGHPSGCPSLRLLEEIQHVRLNVVWVGADGRCADLGRYCTSRPRSGASPPLGARARPPHWPRSSLIPRQRGLRFAPFPRCAGPRTVRP